MSMNAKNTRVKFDKELDIYTLEALPLTYGEKLKHCNGETWQTKPISSNQS